MTNKVSNNDDLIFLKTFVQFSGRSERRPELEDGRWKFPILENPLEGSGIGLEVDVTLIGHVIAETANRQIGKIHCKIFEISLYFFNFIYFVLLLFGACKFKNKSN